MRIALVADFNPSSETHRFTESAIRHSAESLGIDVEPVWIGTQEIPESLGVDFDGIWIAPGGPYQDAEKVLQAIQQARKNTIPCLGTCGGFQQMVIEYARNELGLRDATHEEYAPDAARPIISRLDCSLRGREMTLSFAPGTRVASCYGALEAREKYYCNFGINPEYVPLLKKSRFHVSGSDAEGEVRVMELADHPFFVGTLYVPQSRSMPGAPHPLISGFLDAAKASNKRNPPAPLHSEADAGHEA